MAQAGVRQSDLAVFGGVRAVPDGTFQASPPTTELDEKMVLASLRSGVHAWGENCETLQREFAAWNGNRHCLAVTSGTAALHLCLVACGLAAGEEVITPAYSWTSSASAILHHQGIPVFADVDPRFQNLDPDCVERALTPRTRAILAVHLHGVPAQMDRLREIADRHGVALIEDACQAHGALYRGRKVGTLGECAAFSLNQNKMLSAGEGGLFVTDDEDRLERARSLLLFGDFRQPRADPGYHYYGLAYMVRYHELSAAYARAQLTRLDESIAHARRLFAILRDGLSGIPGLLPPEEPEYGTENGYNFVCHVDPQAVDYPGPVSHYREAVVMALAAEGVPASVWQRRILPEMAAVSSRNAYGSGAPWKPFGSTVSYNPADFPVALRHSDSYFILGGLRLPNGEDAAHRTVEAVRKVFAGLTRRGIDDLASRADLSLYERGWKPVEG
ncbi:MAG TPA: DegT/DnrJ/EryC1/StrS family aminotransferase [Armatimonadota bacterium]|jgi:dTDP-4-amino-4,6-dideoxygalactose transaminase